MLSFLRASAPPRRATAAQSKITYEEGRSYQTFFGASEEFRMLHYIPDAKSFFNPPPHIHYYQDETFSVVSGSGVWLQPTAANPAQRQTVLRAGESIHLPPATYHQFHNASDTEPLVVRIRIDPKMSDVHEEQFFRNFFGYLEDCRAHKSEPSIFQLQLFLLTAQSGIAIPVPGSDSVKWWVSRLAMLFMGVFIGEWLLGYKRTYPEYYSGKDTE